MLLAKIFKHFEIPLNAEVFISLYPINIINTCTLKQMKIVKEHQQRVAYTKNFDLDSSPLTLLFEGNEEEVGNDHDDDIPQVSGPPYDIGIECSSNFRQFHLYQGSLQSFQ